MNKIIVVVPDGIVIKGDEVVPSFVYRSALDAANKYHDNLPIYLAPANSFNTQFYEQEIGEKYLREKGCKKIIHTPTFISDKYIDTWGNAILLRDYLASTKDANILTTQVVLISGYKHMRRAYYCFSKAGFNIVEKVSTSYKIIPNEKMPVRLFYYKYSPLHWFYELFAFGFEIIKNFFRS